MKIEITYNTKSFDPEKFKTTMDLVAQYAKNAKDLKVCATDTAFVCGGLDEFLEPTKIKGVKAIVSGLEKDLAEEEVLTPAEQEMIRDVTCSHHEQEHPVDHVCHCHDRSEDAVSKSVGKCKNCDQEFQMKKKSDKFCSPECRKEYFNHRNKSRAERADEEKNPDELECPVCGNKFKKQHPRQKCCSDDCQKLYTAWNIANKKRPIALKDFIEDRDAKLAEKKRIAELKMRECANPDCKKKFQPTTEDQKYCCKDCKEAAHEKRKAEKIGAVKEPETGKYSHICEVCEMPFSDDSPTQRFCKKCVGTFGYNECLGLAADTLAKKQINVVKQGQRQYKVCPKCGHNFDTIDPNQFFCDNCTARALRLPKVKPLKPLKPEPIPPQN